MEVFTRCLSPKRIYNRYTHSIEYVACGECESCRLKHNRVYTTRVQEEIKTHRFSLFFTLTYSNEYIPRARYIWDSNGTTQVVPCGRVAYSYDRTPLYYSRSKCAACVSSALKDYFLDDDIYLSLEHDKLIDTFGVVSKYDIQCFLKRLRKKLNNYDLPEKACQSKKFRYFISSEYGPTTLRPHYHGILFFDNSALISVFSSLIVDSWGLEERQKGKRNLFTFRPFADVSLTESYIKLCDPNTAYYVADYVNSSDLLPKILRHPLFRPFHLCSQISDSPSYKAFTTEMVENLSKGIASYTTQRIDNAQKCVVSDTYGYSKSNLCSLWLQPYENRDLSANVKSAIYSFIYIKKQEYEKEKAKCLELSVPFNFKFREWCILTYSSEYYSLCLDKDTNWYCSLRVLNSINKYPIFKKLGHASPLDAYLFLMDKSKKLVEQFKLKSFYENLDSWFTSYGATSIFAGYPLLFEQLPQTYSNYCKCFPVGSNIRTYFDRNNLTAKLYPFRDFYSRVLDTDFLESCRECYTDIFQSYSNDIHRQYLNRIKTKKKNNSMLNGMRIIQ